MRFVVPFARGLTKTTLKARQNVVLDPLLIASFVERCEVLSSFADEADMAARVKTVKENYNAQMAFQRGFKLEGPIEGIVTRILLADKECVRCLRADASEMGSSGPFSQGLLQFPGFFPGGQFACVRCANAHGVSVTLIETMKLAERFKQFSIKIWHHTMKQPRNPFKGP